MARSLLPQPIPSICLLLSLLCGTNAWCGEDMVIIVNPSVALTSLSANFARAVFGMRAPQWPGDGEVKVFVLPDQHPLHRAFCKSVLDVFPNQLRTAWDRQVFSGTGQAPIEVASEQEMLERVSLTPGAVGYLEKGQVDAKKVFPLAVR